MLSHSGPFGSSMGMEDPELAMVKAKETRKSVESTRPSRKSIQGFGWRHKGDD
ncbi:hypothetical protein L195_g057061 [Trifolium pratense]|uniref:Uncharacterized protein n=1 Tax=Trifolium pratense TaxID=57577 RepID=A0A2K3KUT1_TRIPR|nr:hypothetical protein L195_g057061 [Trifolium pratense]